MKLPEPKETLFQLYPFKEGWFAVLSSAVLPSALGPGRFSHQSPMERDEPCVVPVSQSWGPRVAAAPRITLVPASSLGKGLRVLLIPSAG